MTEPEDYKKEEHSPILRKEIKNPDLLEKFNQAT
jgi:hypothetical protein